MINTKQAERRKLRFESIDDVLRDIDKIVVAQQAGKLVVTGNWTAGQILAHLAAWIEYGYSGYPVKTPPWPIRFLIKLMLPGALKNGLKPGVRIPGISQGTTGQDDMPVDQAVERLRAALKRLDSDRNCKFDSPAFGPMSHEDRIRLNLRHAELHLSFLKCD